MPATAIDAKRSDTARCWRIISAGRDYFIGDSYTIADISTWGWIDRASRLLKGEGDPLAAYPNIKRWFEAIEACPVVAPRAVDTEHSLWRNVTRKRYGPYSPRTILPQLRSSVANQPL